MGFIYRDERNCALFYYYYYPHGLSLSLSLSLVLADFLFQFGCDSVAKTNDANNVLMESFSKYHQL